MYSKISVLILFFGSDIFLSSVFGSSGTASLTITPEHLLFVENEPVNISCVVKSKKPLVSDWALFTLEIGSSKVECNMLTDCKPTGKGIEVAYFSVGSQNANAKAYEASQNVTISVTTTGLLQARCGGGAQGAWDVIRVLKDLPTEEKTNMTCAFALPTTNPLLKTAEVTWQLPPGTPSLYNGSSSCGPLQADPEESLICSSASLVPLGMTPTEEALLKMAGRYKCHLTAKVATEDPSPAITQTSSFVDFSSKEIKLRKCYPLTGSNCVADSLCSFRCYVFGWPFTRCEVDLPPLADKERVKWVCRYEEMFVDVILDPAYQTDAGIYNISVFRLGNVSEASITYHIRVKDKLAPLWPFLGICGEVVALCVIIILVERRHRKELDSNSNDKAEEHSGDARQRLMPKS